MVVLNDIQKLLLYKRLNLGFECSICQQKFYGKRDYHNHIQEQHPTKGFQCVKCGKSFGHKQILQLHLQIHALSDASATDTSLPNYDNTIQSETSSSEKPAEELTSSQNSHLGQSTVKPLNSQQNKKQVGLTKVKMEDCFRCDACSCIYIDKQDYYKHMRNFHQVSVDNSPVPNRPKRRCRSCCKHCRGTHSNPHKRSRISQHVASNVIFRYSMQDNIKDRWSKISQRLTKEVQVNLDLDRVHIKQEPPDTSDISDFLSQVEVQIKTELPEVPE